MNEHYEPTPSDLHRILGRKQFVQNVLADRVAALTSEVAELMSIIDELQRDLAEARGILRDLKDTEDALYSGVASDHAVVQPVAGEQPVPGRNSTLPSG